MEIRANDLYRSILQQCKADISEADVDSRSRALVEFVDFILAETATEGAAAVKDILRAEIAPWDEPWVLPELARATIDALIALQVVAGAVLERLERLGETEAIEELRIRLEKARELRMARPQYYA
jgi:hypothetical protein